MALFSSFICSPVVLDSVQFPSVVKKLPSFLYMPLLAAPSLVLPFVVAIIVVTDHNNYLSADQPHSPASVSSLQWQ